MGCAFHFQNEFVMINIINYSALLKFKRGGGGGGGRERAREKEREREGEGERDRERGRERQTDTDRYSHRQSDIQNGETDGY